jgi:predicted metal-dependent hydrolase
VNVTWARSHTARASASRRSIKLGSYTSRDRLIRVHPALDAAFVPRFFVEYIVYHEMLHHVLPPRLLNGRRELHGPAFLARERQFHDYQAALRWERENLRKLLKRRARKTSAER